ncbi:hypothetical protein BH09CHL1_BH09CHL1_14200 [soil metagenome]
MNIAAKHIAEFINGNAFKPEQWSGTGLPIIRIAQLTGGPFDNYYEGEISEKWHVRDGDLLFSWSATLDSVIWDRGEGVLNQHIFKVIPRTGVDKRFLFYSLKHYANLWADLDAHGSTMRHIKRESLGNKIYFPNLPTQKAIVDFLDRETARIDQLIEKKQRQVELLEEKLKATISIAVTGRDSAFSTSKTHSGFLPHIPRTWRLSKLKFALNRIEQGWSPECEARLAEDHEWGVLKVGAVNYGRFRDSEHKALPAALTPRLSLEVQSGDLLMSRANTPELVGSVAYVTATRKRLMLSDKLYRLIVDEQIAAKTFLHFVLNDKYVRTQIQSEASGASQSMQNLSQAFVKEIQVALPPLEVQFDIVRELHNITSDIAHIRVLTTKSLERLQELRSSLVTSAVTGQIDIEAWAKPNMTERRIEALEEAAV